MLPQNSSKVVVCCKTSEGTIVVQSIPELHSPPVVVNHLALLRGHVDIYCWYESFDGLPKVGALFMKQSIFMPLFARKQDAKIYLCSLKAWNFAKSLSNMEVSTPIGEAINQINTTFVECIYSPSFFQYCTQVSNKGDVYRFINEELSKQIGSLRLLTTTQKCGMKIAELLDFQPSLLDCIQDLDARSAYPLLRYVEAYYLIQRSVREKIGMKQNKITIAFVLPNDESKYYQTFLKDVAQILLLDFGPSLSEMEIFITFQFFQYGDSLEERPYRHQNLPEVQPMEIHSYFDYLPLQNKEGGFQ